RSGVRSRVMVGSDGFAFLAMTGSLLELPKPYPKRHFRSSHVCRPRKNMIEAARQAKYRWVMLTGIYVALAAFGLVFISGPLSLVFGRNPAVAVVRGVLVSLALVS
ncbi:MAG TPA: hypothetical protein VH092_02155, partial [Urbifossiella sp.]|nr:hypothetical protein [Urbifossiella sp.]